MVLCGYFKILSTVTSFLYHKKANQFKVIQSLNVIYKSGCLAKRKQTFKVAFLFLLHNSAYRLLQQFTIMLHPSSIGSLLVEHTAQFLDGVSLSLARKAHESSNRFGER